MVADESARRGFDFRSHHDEVVQGGDDEIADAWADVGGDLRTEPSPIDGLISVGHQGSRAENVVPGAPDIIGCATFGVDVSDARLATEHPYAVSQHRLGVEVDLVAVSDGDHAVVCCDHEHAVRWEPRGDPGRQVVDEGQLLPPGLAAWPVNVAECVEITVVGVAEDPVVTVQRFQGMAGEVAESVDSTEPSTAQHGAGEAAAVLRMRCD